MRPFSHHHGSAVLSVFTRKGSQRDPPSYALVAPLSGNIRMVLLANYALLGIVLYARCAQCLDMLHACPPCIMLVTGPYAQTTTSTKLDTSSIRFESRPWPF